MHNTTIIKRTKSWKHQSINIQQHRKGMCSLPILGTVSDFEAWNRHFTFNKRPMHNRDWTRDTLHQCIPFFIYRNVATTLAWGFDQSCILSEKLFKGYGALLNNASCNPIIFNSKPYTIFYKRLIGSSLNTKKPYFYKYFKFTNQKTFYVSNFH